MEVVSGCCRAGERLACASTPLTNRNMGCGSALHRDNHLLVDGLPHILDGGCSLIPAYLHLSLVACARVVGHGHRDENMVK